LKLKKEAKLKQLVRHFSTAHFRTLLAAYRTPAVGRQYNP